MLFDEASISQQWTIDDDTGMIRSVGSNSKKLCLTDKNREYIYAGKSVGVAECNQEDQGKKWAIEPMLFNGVSKMCAPKCMSLKSKNGEQFSYMPNNYPMFPTFARG